MEKKTVTSHHILQNARYLLRWTIFALLVGIVGGILGGLFAKAIKAVTGLRAANSWLIFLLPLIGILISALYRGALDADNRGTNMILSAISEEGPISRPTGPLIFASTVLSHLGGASVGREGAALQLGGWLGSGFSELLHLNKSNRHIAVMCGMSAVFAALFGTPVAAAIFCIEVARVGVFHYAALIPCIFSAFTGAVIASRMGVDPEIYTIESIPWLDTLTLLKVAALGLLCAFLAILLVIVFHGFEDKAKKLLPNVYIRAAVCGVIITGLMLLPGMGVYSGAGTELITRALAGEADSYAFLLKLLFTALAIAGGFKGGEIVPTLSIGACFGACFGALAGLPVSLSGALGMIAVFAGATNCPIAALMIAMEMFEGKDLPFFAITVAISFVLSGYYSLYGKQRFAFAKTRY
ncbi:MAG: chloride channel protein [Lachnospiraceae bacterium]|nr:chloride channel protein [Lachnospiraceae bacterium]